MTQTGSRSQGWSLDPDQSDPKWSILSLHPCDRLYRLPEDPGIHTFQEDVGGFSQLWRNYSVSQLWSICIICLIRIFTKLEGSCWDLLMHQCFLSFLFSKLLIQQELLKSMTKASWHLQKLIIHILLESGTRGKLSSFSKHTDIHLTIHVFVRTNDFRRAQKKLTTVTTYREGN